MLSTLEIEMLDQSEIFIELTLFSIRPSQYIETAGYIFFRYSQHVMVKPGGI